MSNCVECIDPPGGRACCERGFTPMCYIKNGKPETVCLPLSDKILQDDQAFYNAIRRELIRRAGKKYAKEINQNFTLEGAIASFESVDGAIKMTARNISSESGEMSGGALAE